MGADGIILKEVILLGESLAVGLVLMAAYDGIRIFRFIIRHGTVWTGIEDIIYWTISSLITFFLLFCQSDGILRWYTISGVLMGMAAYNLTVSRIFFNLLKKAAKYFKIKRTGQRRCGNSQRAKPEKGKGVTEDAGDTKSAEKRSNTEKETGKSE